MRLNSASSPIHSIKRGDILFIDLEDARGSEQGSCRPCICIQNDVGNRFSPTTIIIPLTSTAKKPLPTHVPLSQACGLAHDSIALCEQVRVIDKQRIGRFVGTLAENIMHEIDRALAVSIGLNGYPS